MTRKSPSRLLGTAVAILAPLLAPSLARASDHADGPIGDFYAFLKGDKLVMVMTVTGEIEVRHAHPLFPSDLVFRFAIDRDSKVTRPPPIPARGGGLSDATVASPEGIAEDMVIEVRFPKSGRPEFLWRGFRLANGVASTDFLFFAGVRDEPFIRKTMVGKNIAAIVVEVPLFTVEPHGPLLMWGSILDSGGKTLDHCAHPYRSQLKENEKMNTSHPSQHVKLGFRQPDVLVFDTSQAVRFPNGRGLEDDVVDILSLEEQLPNERPSPTKNDVEFLPVFPYLAPPHDKAHQEFRDVRGPKSHVGMFRRELGRFDLGRELSGMGARDVRLRFWLMNPEKDGQTGTIMFHQHAERPAMVYLLRGAVEEHKWDSRSGAESVGTISAGEVTREAADTEHFWYNRGTEAVEMAAVDLVDSRREENVPPTGQPMPLKAWSALIAKCLAEQEDRGSKAASPQHLARIPLRESMPHIPAAYNYVMESRKWVVQPGELVPLQRHAGRPGITYVVSGVIVEHRDDRMATETCDQGVPLRPGDFTINTNGVSRWLHNSTDQPVELFETDFRNSAHAGSTAQESAGSARRSPPRADCPECPPPAKRSAPGCTVAGEQQCGRWAVLVLLALYRRRRGRT